MKNLIKKMLPASVLNGYRLRHLNLNDYYLLPKSQITYSNDLLYTYHNADFLTEPRFAEAYRLCKEIGGDLLLNYDIQWRIHVLCWAAEHASKLAGDFVDCGVNTGFCPRAVISYVNFGNLPKTYYLLDTFSGMDERYSTAYELERNTKLGYDKKTGLYEQVLKTFAPFKNVQIVKGPIPDTLTEVKTEKIAYLSIDMNCVKPEVDALNYFWDKMVSGGLIILDDYGYPGCIDQKQAHDAFAKSKGVQILSLPTCQGLILKP
jgi:O-methyltransferase